MKIVVLGDIHGRTVWKDIIEKEQPDQVIFLGDYVSTHDCISESDQVSNLLEVLCFKDHHPETILGCRVDDGSKRGIPRQDPMDSCDGQHGV